MAKNKNKSLQKEKVVRKSALRKSSKDSKGESKVESKVEKPSKQKRLEDLRSEVMKRAAKAHESAKGEKEKKEKTETEKSKGLEAKAGKEKNQKIQRPEAVSAKSEKSERSKKAAEEKQKQEKTKAIAAELEKIVAPKTPPPKRLRMKSPAGSVSTTASSTDYKSRQEKAEGHFASLKKTLPAAVKEAELQAELDGAGMLEMLDSLKAKESSGTKAAKELAKIEKKTKQEDQAKDQVIEEMVSESSSAEDQISQESEESPGEVEENQRNKQEASENEEGEGEEEDQEATQEDSAAEASSGEDGEAEGEESEAVEDDESEDEENKPETEKKDKGKGGGKLANAVVQTTKSSVTHKKEWDRFDRSTKSQLKFPASLVPMLKKKIELFNLWVDNDQDWDRAVCQVQRMQENRKTARKQWTAVQAKVLKERLAKDRYEDLIKKRMDAGLYYKDEDYPDDPLETWIYMPEGRMVRSDDITAERLSLEATKKVNAEQVAALISEDGGPLQSGALPQVKAETQAGQQAILQALQDKDERVSKPKKVKEKKADSPETVEPKTITLMGQDALTAVLDKAGKCRTKSIQMTGLEFAGELATQLLTHAGELEKVYGGLKALVSKDPPDEPAIRRILKDIEKKSTWFEKAEASANGILKGSGTSNKPRKAKAKAKRET